MVVIKSTERSSELLKFCARGARPDEPAGSFQIPNRALTFDSAMCRCTRWAIYTSERRKGGFPLEDFLTFRIPALAVKFIFFPYTLLHQPHQ